MIILQKEMLSLFVLLTKRRMVQLFFFFNKNKKNEYNKIKLETFLIFVRYCIVHTLQYLFLCDFHYWG